MSRKVFNRNILGKKIDIGKLKGSNAFIKMKNEVVTIKVYFFFPDAFNGPLQLVGFSLTAAILPYNSNLASILIVEALGLAEGEVADFISYKASDFVKTYMYVKEA